MSFSMMTFLLLTVKGGGALRPADEEAFEYDI